MMPHSKIKVLFHSNYSRLLTGFGKNMKNVLLALHNDPDIEVYEAANGVHFGTDTKTPWKTYGTIPSDQNVLKEISSDGGKQRAASYGHYCIDQIIDDCNPDVYIGIEDIWAFKDFEKRKWWDSKCKIIWSTLDSLPILEDTFAIAPKCDKFLVWASFAEKALKQNNISNVDTVHGAIDYSHFYEIESKNDIRKKFNLQDQFVIGFVFKNQLRKSVPNLLDGFRFFKQKNPNLNTKLLLHTDWEEKTHGWDIPRYIKEKNIDPSDVLCTYICTECRTYDIRQYDGEKQSCKCCGSKESLKTKNNGFGVSESQLNEIYNCMDVYCHPFTSGGQEIPIQEAKSVGLITLVTEYSCGLDSCYEHQGGLPLKWNEYREPFTQFIKATTCPYDIADKLDYVLNLPSDKKQKIIQDGKQYVLNEFCIERVVSKLKQIIIDAHSNFKKQKKPKEESKEESKEENKQVKFQDILDKDKKDRILIVMPESAGDVFMVTSLLPSMKEIYPDKDIYFATKAPFMEILDDNPYIHKVLEYNPSMENILIMEGANDHQGYFELCFLPHIGTQRIFDYYHQGNSDKIMFDIRSNNFNKYASH